MRHNRQTKKLGRTRTERKALLESLVMSLLKHQQIRTTLQKAKAAQRLADHVINLGKTDTLSSRRQVFSYLQDHKLTSRLFKEVAPRFKERPGGYTRVLHLSRRKGDGAQLALLELTEKEIIVKEPKVKGKKGQKAAHTHDHEGHDHEHSHEEGHEHKAAPDKETRSKHDSPKKGPQGEKGFFKNIGKFFRNKGGS